MDSDQYEYYQPRYPQLAKNLVALGIRMLWYIREEENWFLEMSNSLSKIVDHLVNPRKTSNLMEIEMLQY